MGSRSRANREAARGHGFDYFRRRFLQHMLGLENLATTDVRHFGSTVSSGTDSLQPG